MVGNLKIEKMEEPYLLVSLGGVA